ncbi:MAG: DoxX family protein [Saprospiraceae bacterium]|nr:DoxX family protein [Saprospiraceae bacterium]
MKLLLTINWILTTLLSISTGLFKLLQQEADIQLFEKIGFNATATTIVGLVQLIGGILLIPSKTRKIGAYIMIPTFILASIAVFANGMTSFGVVSILFIVMAYLVIVRENAIQRETL